jgi:hypothetical protein
MKLAIQAARMRHQLPAAAKTVRGKYIRKAKAGWKAVVSTTMACIYKMTCGDASMSRVSSSCHAI